MITVLIFIIILGLLVFVHELGHFFVARRNGVKAEEFGFGFPPRIFGFVKDEKTGKYKVVPGGRKVESRNTIFSINWIPLGGFVKIKGESGEAQDEQDSFAAKPAWIRIKVLAAGVVMNFILAWVIITGVFIIGAPESIDDSVKDVKNPKIQITQVLESTPANLMGIQVGDQVIRCIGKDNLCQKKFNLVSEFQNFIELNKGKEVILEIKRGDKIFQVSGIPRVDYPKGEGSLGVGLTRTIIAKYPWYEAIVRGLVAVYDLLTAMIVALYGIISNWITGGKVSVDVTGPIGIAVMTKQVATLGMIYILQFAAILSINLGLINILPIPALDGGRIFFIIIEKIKGSPVSHKAEHAFHTVGFILLITLMVVVTFNDFIRFGIIEKIKSIL